MPEQPTHEQIAELAYKYSIERGDGPGSPEQDWLAAEQALLNQSESVEDK